MKKQMDALRHSTVGTVEYKEAMAQAVNSMKAMAEIATALRAVILEQHEGLQKSVTGIVRPLESMGKLIKVVLELVERPLSLSDDAIERLSDSIDKRLNPMVLDLVETKLNQTFIIYERSIKEMVDSGVEEVARSAIV
ncbi:hypothetical protein [Corynebacterium sp. ES2715-CONJ3]|uniref:hypothetical protein n=1 Tax=Corynebacterium sp. ES2715-CONJ3 TaxID=2974028 RepID=UPI0021684298|nr:hypothetical protein [Corynebacterium sp. ES2715-CONJ3]MCS4491545.1 hypothetical protein [Corynebacterium sp. ES2715-CONJ3]